MAQRGQQNSQNPTRQIGTEEIREIVQILNSQQWFGEQLTLFSFDEKTPLENLEILNKVLAHLDSKHDIDVRDEPQDVTAMRLTEFLKILNQPSNFDLEFQQGLVQGETKVIHPILHWVLVRLTELQKRAYLAKFLVNIAVPDEFLMDEEMQNVHQQYKELQAEFQVTHQHFEVLKQDSMNPNELKKEIQQLEQEKDQLARKINTFKNKNVNKKDFQELLQATSLLRREQEDEARLSDKLREQKQQLEWNEQQLMEVQQRLQELQKTQSKDITAQDMLKILRDDVKKNREMCIDRLGRELSEKHKKLEQIENILNEPMMMSGDLDDLQANIRKAQRDVMELEKKVSQGNPTDDKLAIQKQQAALVAKKKERIVVNLKDLEEEKNELEKKITKKEEEYKSLHGPKQMGRDEFKQYAASLRNKTNSYKRMKAELRDIRAEMALLSRTEQILKSRAGNIDDLMRKLESEQGIEGQVETEKRLEDISSKKEVVDRSKEELLREYSKTVQEIENQLKEKKAQLAPQIKELRTVRSQYQELEHEQLKKKSSQESVYADIENRRIKQENEARMIEEDCNAQEQKNHQLNGMMKIQEIFYKRAKEEASFSSGEKQLSEQHKTQTENYNVTIEDQEKTIIKFREDQDYVKKNYQHHAKQAKLFLNLRLLLQTKLSALKSEVQLAERENDIVKKEVDRLVLD